LEGLHDEASYASTIKIEAEEAAERLGEKVREIARNLIGMSFPDEQIAQATGLTMEEVAKLR
jgi:transcription initiation factor IIE alpha subunit